MPEEGKGNSQGTVLVAVEKWVDHKMTKSANRPEENPAIPRIIAIGNLWKTQAIGVT